MDLSFVRKTVKSELRLNGKGLHSGADVEVRIEPSEKGIWFACGSDRVEARPENVTDTSRCTRLGTVSTIEHLMSAFAALGVTDAEVILSSPELPALDGAASDYCQAISEIGFTEIGAATFSLFERVFFVEDPIRIGVSKGTGHWRFDFESGERWPHNQIFEWQFDQQSYVTDIAPARTFAFEEEVEPIRAAGLAQGLDADSALILGREGYVSQAKWPDEPVRHKLLDLIGDLYLAGVPPQLLNVVAVRSGHRTNVEAARRLAEHAVIRR